MFVVSELCEDGCPVRIVSEKKEAIARINPDLTWSVNWNAVVNQAYAPFDARNIALGAICRLLVAGRDNFRTLPWHSPLQPWNDIQITVGGSESPDQAAEVAFALLGLDDVIACVMRTGDWSVDWNSVLYHRTLSAQMGASRSTTSIPLFGFCELLMGAKDNFKTAPFPTFD
jgi:hypothetical protein